MPFLLGQGILGGNSLRLLSRLTSMSSFSSVEAVKVWYPVRALIWYLVCSKAKRSSSSSWAFFNDAFLKDFQQAVYWSSSNTFISCYLKDVLAAEVSFTSAVLKSSSSGSRSAGAAPRVPVVSM